MTTSDQIADLAAALVHAQGEMGGALKDSANPFFKSKYADLESVWGACRGPLAKYGLAVVQSPSAEGLRVSVETLLIHTSGQWIRGTVSVAAKEDSPQAVGSCITYLRRYALQSFVGVAPEDDDGEAAEGRKNGGAGTGYWAKVAPTGYTEWLEDFSAVVPEGIDSLRRAWKDSKPAYRDHLMKVDPKRLDALQAAAKQAAPDQARR